MATAAEIRVESRFWSKVDIRSKRECWNWKAKARRYGGYGCIRIDGKTVAAHRMSWQLANGPIPSVDGYHGACVLHKCDNPLCVNPDHLFLGSQADNNADKAKKSRCRPNPVKGEECSWSRLSRADVLLMKTLRASGSKLKDLSARFGVSEGHVSGIVRGHKWSHA